MDMFSKPKKTTTNKSRPLKLRKALKVWLILLFIQNALGVVLILDLLNRPADPARPYLLAGLFFFSVIQLAGVFAIWFRPGWGFYTYAAAVIGTTSIGLVLTGSLLIVFYELLPVAITGWLFKDHLRSP
jgi:hypothetical protein